MAPMCLNVHILCRSTNLYNSTFINVQFIHNCQICHSTVIYQIKKNILKDNSNIQEGKYLSMRIVCCSATKATYFK